MTAKSAEQLWTMYPQCRLHCDVTSAGEDSFRIEMSLIDKSGQIIQAIDYFSSGDLATLKEQALEQLLVELNERIHS